MKMQELKGPVRFGKSLFKEIEERTTEYVKEENKAKPMSKK